MEEREEISAEYAVVADAICRQFRPEMVIDVGCGPGFILERMQYHRVPAYGLEVSQEQIDLAPEGVKQIITKVDITTMTRIIGGVGSVVICTDVADHLERNSGHLAKLLASAMCPVILTSRSKAHWHGEFMRNGCLLDQKASDDLMCRCAGLKRLKHMTGVMVFT